MDILLTVIAFIFMIFGILGSFLPILPGPLTSWIGLLILHFTKAIPMNKSFLIITLIVALLIWFLDYIIPALGTKRFGGSKYGMIGTTIGLIVGLIAPIPGGIIVGPFLGALMGELINSNNTRTATKAAFGSFIGFLTSTFIKFVVTIIYLGLWVGIVIDHSAALFSL